MAVLYRGSSGLCPQCQGDYLDAKHTEIIEYRVSNAQDFQLLVSPSTEVGHLTTSRRSDEPIFLL